MIEFIGVVTYWLIIIALLFVLYAFIASTKDIFAQYKVVQKKKKEQIKDGQPFCALVKVELIGEMVTSPLLMQNCLHYKSIVRKSYSRKFTKNYLEKNQKANYKILTNGVSVSAPKKDKYIFVPTVFNYHKKWLDKKIPADLEGNLKQINIEESFWKSHRSTAIDFEEKFLPYKSELWVCGRIQNDTAAHSVPFLAGAFKEQLPIIATSHKEVKAASRYGLISHTSASISVLIFLLVYAYVFH